MCPLHALPSRSDSMSIPLLPCCRPVIYSGCFNAHENCEFWAGIDECEKNSAFMHANCKEACGVCTDEEAEE